MAKALAIYEGFNRQTAKREDGVWFDRSYGFNGYGKAWSKWQKAKQVTLINEAGEQYATEGVAFEPTQEIPAKLLGGFTGDQYKTDLNVRLPN